MPIEYADPGQQVADIVRSRLGVAAAQPAGEQHALAGSSPAELTMSAPHEVYNLGLDQLRAGADPAQVDAGGWRYLLRQGDRTVASAQTAVGGAGEPVFAMFNSGPFVAATDQALTRADQIGGGPDGEALQPRLLHIPALHAMAIWLHSEGGQADVVLPLSPTPPSVDPGRQYTVPDYLAALRRAATAIPTVGADDVTGG